MTKPIELPLSRNRVYCDEIMAYERDLVILHFNDVVRGTIAK